MKRISLIQILGSLLLQESEALFRATFDLSAIGMALTSLDGCFIHVNPALCQILGYSENELLKMDYQSITHPEDLSISLKKIELVLEKKIDRFQIENRYYHKDG